MGLHRPYGLYRVIFGTIKGDRLGVRILSSCFLDSQDVPGLAHLGGMRVLHPHRLLLHAVSLRGG